MISASLRIGHRFSKSRKGKTVKTGTKRSPSKSRRISKAPRRRLDRSTSHDTLRSSEHRGASDTKSRAITANDFTIDTGKPNYIDTLVVVVNFSDSKDTKFTFNDERWNRIFGLADPLTQLNAFFHANYYGQLELRPVEISQLVGPGIFRPVDKYPHVEIELEDTYELGFGIYPTDMPTWPGLEPVDPNEERRFVLDIMAEVVEKEPTLNLQDKLVFTIINADGDDYGRGAMCAVPGGDFFDLFVGDIRSRQELAELL